MIKKFLGEVRIGLLSILRPQFPAWTASWYWLDRYEERKDRTGPRRPVSRFKVVRYAKAVTYQFGPVGWIWTALAVVGLFWLTKGAGFANYLVTVGTALAAFRAGVAWSTRNRVMTIVWDDGCPRCDAEEEL
jgi:hypothetical protein